MTWGQDYTPLSEEEQRSLQKWQAIALWLISIAALTAFGCSLLSSDDHKPEVSPASYTVEVRL